MRIDAFNQISQVYGINGKMKASQTTKTSAADVVEISDFGKELAIAKKAVQNSSDIREDVVAKFKTQVENGTYDVSGEDFADKLMEKFGLM